MAETKIKSQAINIDSIYPVGSIYISTVSTNPSNYFGGTWVAFGAGRTLVGIDAGQTEFDTVEETGGAKTHTLTVTEMPSHTHPGSSGAITSVQSGNGLVSGSGNPPVVSAGNIAQATGGGEAHNNLQPYIVTYFFKRTA